MIIECKEVVKQYTSLDKTVNAVDNVSFQVNKGDFLIILGHSGSGKTTLLSLIGGLTRPDSGEVLIHNISNWQQSDKDLSRLRNLNIGFIFQFASLIPTLTALENLLLPLSFGPKNSPNKDRAKQLLQEVGLLDRADAFPSQLSGGQQRRIAIARAFINNPEIILADEPTGDLDEETEHDIMRFFHKYNEQGTTFLVVTHNKEFGRLQTNPRILHMRNGLLVDEN